MKCTPISIIEEDPFTCYCTGKKYTNSELKDMLKCAEKEEKYEWCQEILAELKKRGVNQS